uniref:Uncharacterized protein n=1 Tax=Lepeophtheirus salmonis TaxID=72036 RepID=A0A0K2TRL0_LEPSM
MCLLAVGDESSFLLFALFGFIVFVFPFNGDFTTTFFMGSREKRPNVGSDTRSLFLKVGLIFSRNRHTSFVIVGVVCAAHFDLH